MTRRRRVADKLDVRIPAPDQSRAAPGRVGASLGRRAVTIRIESQAIDDGCPE